MLPNADSIAARLRLKQLRLLIALDDHGSLHRAADEMALTQPGATKSLREIEATLRRDALHALGARHPARTNSGAA